MPRGLGERHNAVEDLGEEGGQRQELARLQRQLRLLEGDRRAYTDEACSVRMQQESVIRTLEQENSEISTVLRLSQSDKNELKDEDNTTCLQNLTEEVDALNAQSDMERSKITQLQAEIARVEKDICQQRRLNGSNSGAIMEKLILKRTKVIENRHDKAMVKFNNQLAVNTGLREEIDHLRQDKTVFDTLFQKLNTDLEDMRKDMSVIIEEASQAYEQRDEAYNKMLALKERSEKDTSQHEMEMRELQRIIEHDNKLKEFMMIKANDRGEYKEEEDAKKKKAMKGERDVDVENNQILTYEEAFAEIREATGEDDIVRIMTDFLRREDENFALYNYVNELNDEVDKLQEEIGFMKSEIARFEEEDVQMESERKVWLKELEDKSTQSGKEADAADKRIVEMSQVLDELTDGVTSLFRCLGCNRTPINEMLGNETGVTEKNILLYMGIIEQRTMELLHLQHYIDMRNMAPEKDKEKGKDGKTKEPDMKKFRRPPATNTITIAPPGIGEDEDMNEMSEETDLRPLSHEELKHMVMRRINRSTGNAQSINPTLVKDANTQRSPRIPKVEVIQPT
ncbi:coiled-coil domain-containing protein 63-like [Haliotis rufescens]|uniref:coiled-coil domain-containing protein 63-like n=1 Tax=Haliotis rufescens TaxID=6454 RepID=UPI00201EFE72|nr:coiled-coil domain-containing protein 63-like [Haliotis rufescens]